jgi:hypothetical protein
MKESISRQILIGVLLKVLTDLMGSVSTKLCDAYGKTPRAAISALDAKLYIKHNNRVRHNLMTGEYYVVINGRRSFVHVEGTPGIGYRAYIRC